MIRQFKVQKNTYTDRSSIAIEKYLNDLYHMPMLSQEEEVELAAKIKKGDIAARNRLVMGNLRFVVTVAKQYQRPGFDLEDIINEGNIGLITAAERYDETRGFKFISYAVWWIRQQIILALGEKGHLVRMPANKNHLANSIEKQIEQFQQEHQRMPTAEELAERMDLSEFEITNLASTKAAPMSLDMPINEDGDSTVQDVFIDPSAKSTDNELVKESLHHDLLQLMKNTLKEREFNVLMMTFGIDGSDDSYDKIAVKLKITRERVRQIREKALGKLRKCPDRTILMPYLSE